MAYGMDYYPAAPSLSNNQFRTGIMSSFNYNPNQGSNLFGGQNGFGGSGFGFNMDTLQLGLGGLSALGNFWNAYQANSLAKKQFNFTKEMAEANLVNQMKSYNTSLSDRARARGVMEGQTEQEVRDYIDQNQLTR